MGNLEYLDTVAAALASFDFDIVQRCHVRCTFCTIDGKSPRLSIFSHFKEEPIKKSAEEWKELILDTAEGAGGSVERIGGLTIFFKKDDKYCVVQMTDASTGVFDRLCDPIADVEYACLTEAESEQIKGVSDVMRLYKELPDTRWKYEERDIHGFVGLLGEMADNGDI
ncbi:hypothetical protein IKQ65_02905 [Candidatus Saccharibacteria bacterium]|nr:hypothetical protein [Candidatus Saccharibacteria bacterium]